VKERRGIRQDVLSRQIGSLTEKWQYHSSFKDIFDAYKTRKNLASISKLSSKILDIYS